MYYLNFKSSTTIAIVLTLALNSLPAGPCLAAFSDSEEEGPSTGSGKRRASRKATQYKAKHRRARPFKKARLRPTTHRPHVETLDTDEDTCENQDSNNISSKRTRSKPPRKGKEARPPKKAKRYRQFPMRIRSARPNQQSFPIKELLTHYPEICHRVFSFLPYNDVLRLSEVSSSCLDVARDPEFLKSFDRKGLMAKKWYKGPSTEKHENLVLNSVMWKVMRDLMMMGRRVSGKQAGTTQFVFPSYKRCEMGVSACRAIFYLRERFSQYECVRHIRQTLSRVYRRFVVNKSSLSLDPLFTVQCGIPGFNKPARELMTLVGWATYTVYDIQKSFCFDPPGPNEPKGVVQRFCETWQIHLQLAQDKSLNLNQQAELFKRLIKLGVDLREKILRKAMEIYTNTGNNTEAIQCANMLLESEGSLMIQDYRILAKAHLNAGEPEKAAACYEEILRQKPVYETPSHQGYDLFLGIKANKALQKFARVRELSEKVSQIANDMSPENIKVCATYFHSIKLYTYEAEFYEKILRQKPNQDYDFFVDAAEANFMAKMYPRAMQLYEKVLSSYRHGSLETHRHAAMTHYKLAQYKQAAQIWERAMELALPLTADDYFVASEANIHANNAHRANELKGRGQGILTSQ